jgi:hypothetical protein
MIEFETKDMVQRLKTIQVRYPDTGCSVPVCTQLLFYDHLSLIRPVQPFESDWYDVQIRIHSFCTHWHLIYWRVYGNSMWSPSASSNSEIHNVWQERVALQTSKCLDGQKRHRLHQIFTAAWREPFHIDFECSSGTAYHICWASAMAGW